MNANNPLYNFFNLETRVRCRVRPIAEKKKETYRENTKRSKLKTCNI